MDPQHIYREFSEEVDLLSEQALFPEDGKIFFSYF